MASDYGTLGARGVSALGAVDAWSCTLLWTDAPHTDPCAASLAGALQRRPRRRHNLHVCSTVAVGYCTDQYVVSNLE
jgi:hypothetical protein